MTLSDDLDLEEYITAKDDLSGADIKVDKPPYRNSKATIQTPCMKTQPNKNQLARFRYFPGNVIVSTKTPTQQVWPELYCTTNSLCKHGVRSNPHLRCMHTSNLFLKSSPRIVIVGESGEMVALGKNG